MDLLDLLAVQGTLKSLLQQHTSKASILQCLVFIMVQLSHLNMTTGKTTALTLQTFVGKVISLLFNMLSRFVIAFLSRSKCLLISWLQSSSTVIWGPPKEYLSLFPLFPHLFAMKWWDWMSLSLTQKKVENIPVFWLFLSLLLEKASEGKNTHSLPLSGAPWGAYSLKHQLHESL